MTNGDERAIRIAKARSALAAAYAADPAAVERFEARMAALAAAAKRQRQRVQDKALGHQPAGPDLTRPSDMSRNAWKVERARRVAAHKKPVRRLNDPTPEQADKALYVEVDVNEHSQRYDDEGKPFIHKVRIGRAFQRQPRFETIDGITVAQLLALRRYRRAFDVSEVSPVKSGLDIGVGGGAGGVEAAIARIEAVAFADIQVLRLEEAVSPNLRGILRAVALHDLDFKAVADDRYGSTSGKRRQQVKGAFLMAAQQLATGIARAKPCRHAEAVGPVPIEEALDMDPAFLDDRGLLLPWEDIAALIRERFAIAAGSEP